MYVFKPHKQLLQQLGQFFKQETQVIQCVVKVAVIQANDHLSVTAQYTQARKKVNSFCNSKETLIIQMKYPFISYLLAV